MLKFDRKRYPLAVLGVLLVLFLVQGVLANHSWANYHWARQSNPFTVQIGDNVSSAWDSYLGIAAIDWTQSSVLDAVVTTGLVTNPKTCKPTLGRIEVCNSKYGNNGWLGIAQIWITEGVHITQAITKLNDTYFSPTYQRGYYNTPAWRQMVTCQEVGHNFGLDHQDENFDNANLNTCMDYTSSPESNQHPNQHDYDQLVQIYSHSDSTTTLGQATAKMPPAMSDIEFEGPGQWGKLVAESARGRTSTYEADFGNGNKVVTHVFWVEGRERGKE